MDIRIVRVLMISAHQINDAGLDALNVQLRVLENAFSSAESKAQAEEAIPALRALVRQGIEGIEALSEIIADHKAAIASVDALPSTVFPPDGPGDDGGQKH